jgi:tetratricopeptide (TPR) repeat protein
LNAEFTEFARKRAAALAPKADWSEPELPRRAPTAVIDAWLKDHPNNYAALQRLAGQFIGERKWEEAKQPLEKMRSLYPEDASNNGPYALLAVVHRELGEAAEERAALEKLAGLSADSVEIFARLAELTAAEEEWELTKQYAAKLLAVSPLRPAPHRSLAQAADKLGDEAAAIDSYQALLLLDPIDPAELHLQLATRLQTKGDLDTARRHVLLALEETPRFRAGHERLLAIVREREKKGRESGARSQGSEEDKSIKSDSKPPATEKAE